MQQRLDLSRLTLEALILRVRTAFAVAAVAAAILVWQAAAGQAATVAVTNHDLAFTAPGAEVNDLLVGRHSGVFEVRDLAATLVAGAGCNSVTGHEATCATTGIRSFTAALGQGGDQALVKSRLRLASVVVRGGSGADDLVSLVAAVQFLGGPGDDRLKGGTGDDALWGNRGDDVVRGGSGADILHGGLGDDLVRGGTGWDRGFGGPGDDLVYGERGHDILRGGPGEDRIADFYGLDRLYGGAAADYLNTFELDNPIGEPGDYLNAGVGPDYGCRASPGDVLVGCDERAKHGSSSRTQR